MKRLVYLVGGSLLVLILLSLIYLQYKINLVGNWLQRSKLDTTPSWAPDGSAVAFSSTRDGKYEIYTWRFQEEQLVRITNNDVHDNFPVWSPNMNYLVFTREENNSSDLYRCNADGSAMLNLTKHPSLDGGYYVSWAPDGRSMLFQTRRDGQAEIYRMQADGTNLVNLSQHTASDKEAQFSPDGERIAFVSNRDGDFELFTMLKDGSEVTQLTFNEATENYPCWSPDGQKIAYQYLASKSNNAEILIINLADNTIQNVSNNKYKDKFVRWSPDGKQLLFVSERDGESELYTLDLETTEETRLSL